MDPRVSTTLYASSGASFEGSNCKGTPAGGECGLYKSVDNGVTWTQLGLQSPSADSLSIDPVSGAIYAGGVLTGSSGAIFKSTDGGTTFTPLKNGFPLFGPYVRIDPNNPSTVYAFAQDGVSVTIGGKAAYINYISAVQINLLAPDVAFGTLPVTVMTAGGTSATFNVTSNQYGPAFFEWPNAQPVATRQDFSWAVKNGTFSGTTTVPAKPGDVIILWGNGFGPTNPVAPVGAAVPSDKTYSTTSDHAGPDQVVQDREMQLLFSVPSPRVPDIKIDAIAVEHRKRRMRRDSRHIGNRRCQYL